MMLTDLQLLDRAWAMYTNAPTIEDPYHNIHATVWEEDGFLYVGFEGSKTPRDWFDDIHQALWPRLDPVIGYCHPTLDAGVRYVFDQIDRRARAFIPLVVFGHSKGGGEAEDFAARNVARGRTIARLVTWGGCHIMSRKGGALLADAKVPMALYRNGDDPVPDVPYIPFVYRHPAPHTHIGTPRFLPFSCHYLQAYRLSMLPVREAA
jgi:hypothetical protein